VLERNPSYWNKGYPHLDRVVLRPLPDSQSRFASLKAGETDIVWADEFEADAARGAHHQHVLHRRGRGRRGHARAFASADSLTRMVPRGKWCGGTIEQRPTKMMGTTTDLPVIMVPGVGEHRGESFPAALGCVIVEFKGSFRVYKPQQFQQAFDPVKKTVVLGNTIQEMTIGSDDVRHAMGIDTPVEI